MTTTANTDQKHAQDLKYGHPIPCVWVRKWGARACYDQNRSQIDLLHDRQDYKEIETAGNDSTEFVTWINETALPWLRKEVKRRCLSDYIGDKNNGEEVTLTDGKYELRASTHGSFGYLYIGAVEKGEE